MIELIASIVITVSSALLFAYWFRWACVLLRKQNRIGLPPVSNFARGASRSPGTSSGS